MKENEAPEKIYLQPTKYGETYNHWSRLKLDETFVEYSRTDAFMKKACKFLSNEANIPLWEGYNDTFGCDTSKLVDNFRKYMEE